MADTCAVEALLRGAPESWMTIAHVTQYQVLFLDQPYIEFHKMSVLNCASLLLDKDPMELPHDCLEVADLIQSDRPDLTGVSMATPDQILVIDENNLFKTGSVILGQQQC